MSTAGPIILRPKPRPLAGTLAPGASHAPVPFAAGEEIYAPGDRADRLYRVEYGTVRVFRLLADGRRQISAFHLAGEVFGFETDGLHRFFADAITPTGLHELPRPSAGRMAPALMDMVLRQFVRTQEHLLVVGRQNAVERIASFLLDMAKRQGDLDHLDLPMSRTDIADYLGLTIETVSRVLSRLRVQGVIRLTGLRTVEIAKPAVLQAICA